MASPPLAKIGVISIGDMGMGIAKLLIANGFSVATNCKGRSDETLERAKSAQVEICTSDEQLTEACDVILSVVPPRDATATAQRIVDAVTGPIRRDVSGGREPLYFADLNAVAPSTVRSIAALFEQTRGQVRFLDGAIIGAPPKPSTITTTTTTTTEEPSGSSSSGGGGGGGGGGDDGSGSGPVPGWSVPNVPMSGPHRLAAVPGYGAALAAALNARHVSDEVGAASGLKMCFASLTKGFTSLAVQSFTTARRLGVLDELREELRDVVPAHGRAAERGVVGMPPKAYRWVREMEEIALAFDEDGGFPPDLFRAVADVYRAVADDTVLGREKVGARQRGLDVDDVAAAMAEGLENKRKKND
ncbi:putative 6-phosphogluconate dehydrogenase [Rosellinia necatrix]|uniref:Putative 6-phosphogluconate dehydrogenase n=1 Tax=Rosellinia necatrix TaxID=77044 RepID=A0A1W2TAZ7_ROSNE|nr:putative 6-phosphogluconate dehydrogenase [Rosellinia necatrix]